MLLRRNEAHKFIIQEKNNLSEDKSQTQDLSSERNLVENFRFSYLCKLLILTIFPILKPKQAPVNGK